MLSDHIITETNKRKIAGKIPRYWKLNDTLLNNTSQRINLKRNLRNMLNEIKMNIQFIKICGLQ